MDVNSPKIKIGVICNFFVRLSAFKNSNKTNTNSILKKNVSAFEMVKLFWMEVAIYIPAHAINLLKSIIFPSSLEKWRIQIMGVFFILPESDQSKDRIGTFIHLKSYEK